MVKPAWLSNYNYQSMVRAGMSISICAPVVHWMRKTCKVMQIDLKTKKIMRVVNIIQLLQLY